MTVAAGAGAKGAVCTIAAGAGAEVCAAAALRNVAIGTRAALLASAAGPLSMLVSFFCRLRSVVLFTKLHIRVYE